MTTNTIKNALIALLVVAIFATTISAISLGTSANQPAFGDSSYPNSFPKTATSSKETVAATSVDVLATSTSRTWAIVSNTSTNGAPAYCTFNGSPATAQGGILVAASTSPLVINQSGLYTGAVNCVSNSTATLWVEAVQS